MAKHEKISQADAVALGARHAEPFIPQITIGTFALSDTTHASLQEAGADRRMSRTALTCHRGGIDVAIAHYADNPTPKLLILEIEPNPESLFAKLDHFAAICPPATLVVLLGSDNDVALYRRLMRSGISEYLVTPLTPLALIDAIGGLFDDETADRRAPVTAFFGARGGCGASVLAQNAAWSLAYGCDTSVLLIDLDLAAGTSALRLNLDPAATVATALGEGTRLDKSVLDRMILRKDNKFALLASPADLTDICTQESAGITRLIDVARTMTSHVVLDLPSGWSRYTESFLEIAEQTVLVATPDLVSLRNCGKIVRAMRRARPNDPPPRIVLSHVGMPRSQQIAPAQFAEGLGMAVSVEVPFDAGLFSKAENEGRLVAQLAPAGAAGARIKALANLLNGQSETQAVRRKRGRFTGLRSLLA